MAARNREAAGGGSFWWPNAGQPGSGGGFAFGEMSENELAALGGFELQDVELVEADLPQEGLDAADIFQLSYPRPRLRWTTELHDKFVMAVDELGGANKATPKGIQNLMRVHGVTLYHIKSHLQKYRLGKMGRKLWRRDYVPPNYYRQRGIAIAPAMQAQRQLPSIFPSVLFGNNFNININGNGNGGLLFNNNINRNAYNNGMNTMGAQLYGNQQLLVNDEKHQAAMENFEFPAKFAGLNVGSSSTSSISAFDMDAKFPTAAPSLLPLFPPISAGMNYCPYWSDFLRAEARTPAVSPPPPPCPEENTNASVDNYLDSFGNSSFEFAPQSHEYSLCNGGMSFGSFFDEVASFAKVDGIDHLTSDIADANLLPMEAHEHY